MSTTTTRTALETAQAALDRLLRCRERTAKRLRQIESEISKARKVVERERVKMVVGRQVKVDPWYWPQDGEPLAWIRGAVGILIEVKRKYCTVDYGRSGTVDVPLMAIIPADADEGRRIVSFGR